MTGLPDIYSYNLGSYHRKVTTNSASAQTWFDRGLVWTYAFNHEEAIACFQKAIDSDPDCAVAYWGLAYASGPNYNKPWEFFDHDDFVKTVQQADCAALEAKKRSHFASPAENALIQALQHRYPSHLTAKYDENDFRAWNQSYADAMRNVHVSFPGDLDVATLFVDALMNVTPWALWDIKTGEPASGANTIEAKTILDRALSQPGAESHPGLLHMYIHLMEMSSRPEDALPRANKLRGLVPDAGHLNHMPTHLDILCGDYEKAAIWNQEAIRADEKYLSQAGPVNFYTLYRSHNYHFRIYAAMFAGKSKIALESVEELGQSLPEDLLRITSPPMADWLEGFLSIRVHVYIRFGMWDKILALPLPHQDLYCVTRATTRYGRGIALAALSRPIEAEVELSSFNDALEQVPSSRMLFNNRCIDILQIAKAMLQGEIEYRTSNFDTAYTLLKKAVDLDDNLPYDEPWGWMQPTRHALGALLLEQERVSEAKGLFRADLGLDETLPRALQHRNNVWSLHGYSECLKRCGREDAEIEQSLKKALELADIPIRSSCFCRLKFDAV